MWGTVSLWLGQGLVGGASCLEQRLNQLQSSMISGSESVDISSSTRISSSDGNPVGSMQFWIPLVYNNLDIAKQNLSRWAQMDGHSSSTPLDKMIPDSCTLQYFTPPCLLPTQPAQECLLYPISLSSIFNGFLASVPSPMSPDPGAGGGDFVKTLEPRVADTSRNGLPLGDARRELGLRSLYALGPP